MTKKRLSVLVAVVSVFAMVLTMGVATKAFKKNVNAASAKVSVSKCNVSTSGTEFEWTGKAIKPGVSVTYGTTRLKRGTDYTVSYSDNVNAGTAKVTIKGINNYKGSKTVNFTIKGISIEKDCEVKFGLDDAKVYYNGELVDESNYTFSSIYYDAPSRDFGNVKEYIRVTTYTVTGKGKFYGSVSKTTKVPILEYDEN